ncbi:MAG: hypothetical protein COB66_05910 [Coxiella sp. (in: Bacteria)]|nr:MAG: hypothetical protein COB66_05910 [Coxiella sp. (in: g-proteobacteria)]
MDARASGRRNKFVLFQWIRLIFGVLVVAIGIIVLVGWYARLPALIQVLPRFVPMQYNTAIGFILSGIGLLLLRYRYVALFIGVLILLLGTLTLIEYIVGIDLGIDQLFMNHYLITNTSHPGRMAPNTAICFTLTGGSLLITWFRKFNFQTLGLILLSIVIIVLGVIALFGYSISIATTYGWGLLTHMAVHTAIGFIIVGFGLLFYSMGYQSFRFEARLFKLPLMTFIICMAITVMIWQAMLGTESTDLTKSLRQTKNMLANNITLSFKRQLVELNQLLSYWDARGSGLDNERLRSASQYFKMQTIKDIAWINDRKKLQWIHRSKIRKDRQVIDQPVVDYMGGLTDSNRIQITKPVKTKSGIYVIGIYRSIYKNNVLQGKVTSILYLNEWINTLVPDFIKRNFVVLIKYKDNYIYQSTASSDKSIQEKWQQITQLKLGNETILLEIYPTRRAYNDFYSWSPTFIFVGGLILSMLLGLICYMWLLGKRSKWEAESANEAKSLFLSSMSHELRTPLNAAIGYAQLLEQDPSLSADQKSYAKSIYSSNNHLLTLINDILDLSKIESGKVELSIESVLLNDIMAECLELVKPMLDKYNVTLFYDVNAYARIYIKGDYVRLKQIMLNLISNAIKYNKLNGSVTVSIDSIFDNKIRIQVTDTGRGISKHNQKKLFQPFQRLGEEQGDTEGTGIGLVIMKKMVELLGGTVRIKSIEGVGTNVFLTLSPGKFEEAKHRALSKQVSTGQLQNIAINTSLKILLVEDNPSNQAIASQQLLFFNCNVDIASNGEEGYNLWGGNDYGLILMDCNMPVMDGYELTKRIRQEESITNRHIPIIAFTANAFKEDLNKCYAAGMDDYLIKPVELSILKEKLIRWLPNHGTISESFSEQKQQSSRSQSENNSLIDMSILEKYVGSDKNIQLLMLDKFIESANDIMSSLLIAHDNASVSDIQFQAHKLKSSSKAMGASSFSELCLQLENAAKKNNMVKLDALMPKIELMLNTIRIEIKSMTDQPDK